MRISFSPIRSDAELSVARAGSKLIINGIEFDFSPLPDGATLPANAIGSEWIVGDVSRTEGKLQICLLMPHGPKISPETAFPQPLVDPIDGPISLPNYSRFEETTHGDA